MPRSELAQTRTGFHASRQYELRAGKGHVTANQLQLPVLDEDASQLNEKPVRRVNVIRDLADYVPGSANPRKPVASDSPALQGQLRRLAIRRIQRLAAVDDDWGHKTDSDPVQDADHRTSMSDARIALNAALGVDINDIDPATGYDVSRQAYERSRSKWRKSIEQQGWDIYTAIQYAKVRAGWAVRHPEWVVGDDWLEGLIEVQAARQALDEKRKQIRKVIEGEL